MTGQISLARLRDISKQRSIRQPQLIRVPMESADDRCDPSAVELPIPS